MKSLLAHQLLALFAFLVIFSGCKQPETIVVDETPTAAAPSDTLQDDISSNAASFRKLVIGEYHAIDSMDPLLAEDAATMRAIQLVFEGLTRLDASGSVVPGLAKDWEVNKDSLSYTFTLRDSIYFQDGDIFSTGTGRKMAPDDVKFVFERMARPGVPPAAANLFMSIEGFEPYFQEQHEVYLSKNRTLDGVGGIQTPNDSTVVFTLTEQDPNFLKKLATPLAVIYPHEAVGRTTDFTPVGSGPFQLSSQQSDTTFIFSKFKGYYAASNIQLDRVDLISSSSESQLFRAMGRDEIFVLPEMGPQTLPVLLNDDGTLQTSYSDRYKIKTSQGFTEYLLRYHPKGNLSTKNAQAIAGIAKESTPYFDQFPGNFVQAQNQRDTTETSLSLSGNFSTVFSEDPYVKSYLGSLAKSLDRNGVTLQMGNIRTPTRNTSLFFTRHYPLLSAQNDAEPLFKFRVSQISLQRKEVSGLEVNAYPWWFDLRGVTLPAFENLN